MPERNIELIKIIMISILSSLLIFPPLFMIVRRAGRAWLKVGVEGDNEKPDIHEVWETIFMFMALGCFFTMVYMILDKSINGVQYEVYEYAMVFSGTLGSNTASAFIIWVKQKYSK